MLQGFCINSQKYCLYCTVLLLEFSGAIYWSQARHVLHKTTGYRRVKTNLKQPSSKLSFFLENRNVPIFLGFETQKLGQFPLKRDGWQV